MSDVSLTAAQRASLVALQRTNSVTDRTNQNLTTGRSVNSVNDNPTAFFIAQQLTQRGAEFTQRREEIDQGISTLRTSLAATDTIEQFSRQLQGLAESARSTTDPSQLAAISRQFEQIGNQISQVAQDASFNGTNLLSSTNNRLEIQFSDQEESGVSIQGRNLISETADTANGLFSVDAFDSAGDIRLDQFGLSEGDFTSLINNPEELDTVIRTIEDGISRLRGQAQQFGGSVALLQERAQFNDAIANELQAGADNLTLADLNEEAALNVASRTSQQIATQSLGVSGGQQRALLSLIEGSA